MDKKEDKKEKWIKPSLEVLKFNQTNGFIEGDRETPSSSAGTS